MRSLDTYFDQRQDSMIKALSHLISLDTTTPNEDCAQEFLNIYLHEAGLTPVITKIPETIKANSFYTNHSLSRAIDSGWYMTATRPREHKRKVCFQTHIDVVPLSDGMVDGFMPTLNNGEISGRGACDAKGNLVMIVEALHAITQLNLKPLYDIEVAIVCEEEIGGNGALAHALAMNDVDLTVIFEPTDFEVFYGHRGCVTFTICVRGAPTHVGSTTLTRNPIEQCLELIPTLKKLKDRLNREARQDPMFSSWDNPIHFNIGKISGGTWHGMNPGLCTMDCSLGVPVGTSVSDIKEMVLKAIQGTMSDVQISSWGLVTEGYTQTETNELIDRFQEICGKAKLDMRAWNASCDARHYPLVADTPSIIFGCGKIETAHSINEKVSIHDIANGAKSIIRFLTEGTGQTQC